MPLGLAEARRIYWAILPSQWIFIIVPGLDSEIELSPRLGIIDVSTGKKHAQQSMRNGGLLRFLNCISLGCLCVRVDGN